MSGRDCLALAGFRNVLEGRSLVSSPFSWPCASSLHRIVDNRAGLAVRRFPFARERPCGPCAPKNSLAGMPYCCRSRPFPEDGGCFPFLTAERSRAARSYRSRCSALAKRIRPEFEPALNARSGPLAPLDFRRERLPLSPVPARQLAPRPRSRGQADAEIISREKRRILRRHVSRKKGLERVRAFYHGRRLDKAVPPNNSRTSAEGFRRSETVSAFAHGVRHVVERIEACTAFAHLTARGIAIHRDRRRVWPFFASDETCIAFAHFAVSRNGPLGSRQARGTPR